MNKKWQVSSLIASALLLGACGGSGSNDMTDRKDIDIHNASSQNTSAQSTSKQSTSKQSTSKQSTSKQSTSKQSTSKVNTVDKSVSPWRIVGDKQVSFFMLGSQPFAVQNGEVLFEFSALSNGFDNGKVLRIVDDNSNEKDAYKINSYNQFYSSVVGFEDLIKDDQKGPIPDLIIRAIAGSPTPISQLPAQGSVDYNGVAFADRNHELAKGDFQYTIDFATKTGYGHYELQNIRTELTNARLADQQRINEMREALLLNAKAQAMFVGKAVSGEEEVGDYMIGLYGPHAEEVAGVVKDGAVNLNDYWTVGLAGKKK